MAFWPLEESRQILFGLLKRRFLRGKSTSWIATRKLVVVMSDAGDAAFYFSPRSVSLDLSFTT